MTDAEPRADTDSSDADALQGEVPTGVGPEVFHERLVEFSRQDPETGANITIAEEVVFVDDIQSVEREAEGHASRVRLRSGVIIGGLTGAAIVAALATVRYRRRHRA
jgi:hypothetical protein